MTNLELDQKLIGDLGGPAKVAELLGYEKEGGVQRVHNWLSRGIPADVKVGHPQIFLRHLLGDQQATGAEASAAHPT